MLKYMYPQLHVHVIYNEVSSNNLIMYTVGNKCIYMYVCSTMYVHVLYTMY